MNRGHVRYRNSKLTWLLQDTLLYSSLGFDFLGFDLRSRTPGRRPDT